MEKPGMDRRRKSFGAGLLNASPAFLPAVLLLGALIFPLFLPVPLWAESAPAPWLFIETAPDHPRSGGFLVLTVLVDHPRPGEVEVRPPPFPAVLVPGLSRREPRLIGEKRWTVVEYHFTLRGSGRLTLAPFEVICPLGRSFSSPLVLDIEAAEVEALYHPLLVWENIPPRLGLGESLEFSLRLSGWDPRRPMPDPAVFAPEAPEGFILETLNSEPQETGLALRLRLIPLAGAAFYLPARTIRSGALLLEIPPLRIPVSPSTGFREGPKNPLPPVPPGGASLPEDFPAFPFPDVDLSSASIWFFRSTCLKALVPVRASWEAGDRVRALAELRACERRHPAGPLFRPLRRTIEAGLGLDAAGDEPWRPRILFRIGIFGSLGLILFSAFPRFFRRSPAGRGEKKSSSGRRFSGFPAYRVLLLVLLAIGGFSAWGLIDGIPGGKRPGVLRETEARRIPDPAGTVIGKFREGQAVQARSFSGPWIWVEAPDSPLNAGWIPASDIVFYP
ncbi:MAG: hypothetical protein LBK02_04625 [Treponema sp.]|jgi:hypothetical protein|nr:hypothetical protein [Treponema sp.]